MRSLALAATLAIGARAEWDACELPAVSWIAHDDAAGTSMAYALAAAGDDVFVSGTFQDTLRLRGPTGSADVSGNSGVDDVFFGKLSSTGAPQLLRGFQNTGRDLVVDMDYDGSTDMVAMTGYFLGSLNLDGVDALVNTKPEGSGDYDGFTAVVDASTGVVQWVRALANDRETKLFGVSIANGRVVVAGYTCEEDVAAAVDPATGRKPDACSGVVADYALADGNGAVTSTFDGMSFSGVKHAPGGASVFVVGSMSADQVIAGSTLSLTGASDAVVLRLGSALAVDWAASLGTAGAADAAWDLDVDAANVYVSGLVSTSVAGARTFKHVSASGGVSSGATGYDGSEDGCVVALAQSSGALAFGVSVPYARGIRLGEAGASIYLMGLRAGGFFSNGHSLGSYDVFLAKLRSSDGFGLWAMDLGGGAGFEYPWSLAVTANGDAYISGLTASSSLRFGDREVTGLPSDAFNMFVAKVATSAEAVPSCKSSCATIKAGSCFIGNQCFNEGPSPFAGRSCFACDPERSATGWSGPDLNGHCLIDGACVREGAFKGAGGVSVSECEYCSVARTTSAWTLHAGYANADCEDDGDDATQMPGCGGLSRNEAFCSASKPCYDSTTDTCNAVVDVCTAGLFYTTQCPNFPAEACYNLTEHDCKAPTQLASSPTCPVSAVFASNCPGTHPCFDHVDLVCVPRINTPTAAAATLNPAAVVGLMLILAAALP